MSLSAQFLTMIAMIGMGMFFGATFDTYNRFLKRRKRSAWIVFINDILFWVAQGLLIFYVLLSINQGELRFYVFVALFCGFSAYQALFKRTFLKVLDMLISMIISLYRFIVRLLQLLIVQPFKAMSLLLVSAVLLTGRGIVSLLKFLLSVVLSCLKLIWRPVLGLLRIIWNVLPKGFQIYTKKLYNKIGRWIKKLNNFLHMTIIKIKKYKK